MTLSSAIDKIREWWRRYERWHRRAVYEMNIHDIMSSNDHLVNKIIRVNNLKKPKGD
jgi:hypothetical protein